jgi:hypothetical protein
MLAIIRLLVTFGPEVIELISETLTLIKKSGAGKDRKKAERVMYVAAWKRAHNITGRPPVPPRSEE